MSDEFDTFEFDYDKVKGYYQNLGSIKEKLTYLWWIMKEFRNNKPELVRILETESEKLNKYEIAKFYRDLWDCYFFRNIQNEINYLMEIQKLKTLENNFEKNLSFKFDMEQFIEDFKKIIDFCNNLNAIDEKLAYLWWTKKECNNEIKSLLPPLPPEEINEFEEGIRKIHSGILQDFSSGVEEIDNEIDYLLKSQEIEKKYKKAENKYPGLNSKKAGRPLKINTETLRDAAKTLRSRAVVEKYIKREISTTTEIYKKLGITSLYLDQLRENLTKFYNNILEKNQNDMIDLNDFFSFDPCVRDSLYENSPEKSIEFFLKTENLETLCFLYQFNEEEFEYTPFFNLSELAQIIKSLKSNWEQNREYIIKTGYPKREKQTFKWLNLIKYLYPVKYQGRQETSYENGIAEYTNEFEYFREYDEKIITYEEAKFYEWIPFSDAIRIEKNRGLLCDLYINIFEELYKAANENNSKKLWEMCINHIRNILSPEDLTFYFNHDLSNCLWADELEPNEEFKLLKGLIIQEPPAISDKPLITEGSLVDKPEIIEGSLIALFEVIGHFEKEITIGTFNQMRTAFNEIYYIDKNYIPELAIDRIYQLSDESIDIINAGVKLYYSLISQEKQFGEQFLNRFKEEFKTELDNIETEVVTTRQIKKKYSDNQKKTMEGRADYLIQLEKTGIPTHTDQNSNMFIHSDDFRSLNFKGEEFTLTPRQAEVIQILHEAYKSGIPGVAKSSIYEKMNYLGKGSLKTNFFKKHPHLYEKLIAKVAGSKDQYKLNI